ncbi:MAG: ABC transporter permease [Candidatus Acidiferrum sp.]
MMRRIRRVFQKSRSEKELDQELRFHLDRQIADYVAAGISPDEARRRAKLEFGGLDRVKDEVRDTRFGNFIETLFQDLSYGMRMLKKSPSLTAIIVITLALGIGVNTAIFSVLNGWLFRPLPVQAPEQIDVLAFTQQHDGSNFSYADLLDFRNQSDAFSDLFAYGLSVAGLSANGRPREFAYSSVTGNYFSALGVRPAVGRFFLPGEGETRGSPLLVVLGNSYWQKNFGSDTAAVGKQVLVNGQPATIIGVTPKDFHGTFFAFDMDGYLTLNAMAMDKESSQFWTDRRDRRLIVLGRLKPNLSTSQAAISSDIAAQRLAAQYPSTNKDVTIRVIPERLARPAVFVSSFVPVIAGLFFILAGLVLLLACMNVANILLARSAARRREMAIRSALGARRGRLMRQMLTESLLLSLLGGTVGVLFGKWSISASGSALHSVTTTTNFAYKMDCSLDWRVFSYTLAAAILTGVLVGLLSALRASRADVNEVLQGSGRDGSSSRSGSRIRSALVVVQVAGSLILLIVAGLFVRSLRHTEQMYLGFEPDHVLNVMLDPHQIGDDEIRAKAFYRELEDRTRTMSGVQSVSLSFAVPLGIPGHVGFISAEGHPVRAGQQPPETSFNSVDPAYFATMRIPILRGRTFTESDNDTAPQVAIVNQTMAKKLWPNDNPVGKRFRWTGESGPYVEVVGVAQDGQYFFLSPDSHPYFYLPLAQNFSSRLSLQIRSSSPPESLILAVQEQVRALAPDLPIIDLSTMQQTVRGLGGLFVFRLAASLAAALGFLGLSLAVVGVYGIVSFGMIQRTREMGIRVALGASRKDILKLALGSGFALISAGVILGVVSAWISTHAMRKLLIGVTGSDPATYAAAVAAISAVALLACWIPARRATKMDPLIALRYE